MSVILHEIPTNITGILQTFGVRITKMLSFLLCFVHVALTVLTVACGAASASASTSSPSLFDLYTVSDGPRRAVDLDVVRDFGAVGDGVADDTAPIHGP